MHPLRAYPGVYISETVGMSIMQLGAARSAIEAVGPFFREPSTMTTGRILEDFLSGDKRVEHLFTDLLRLIQEGRNPAFRDWDLLQSTHLII